MATNRKGCSLINCNRPAIKSGLCYKCYVAEYGKPPYPCKEEGCTKNAFKGGLCFKHSATVIKTKAEEAAVERPHRNTVISVRSEYISALRNRKADLLDELSMINTSLSIVEAFTR